MCCYHERESEDPHIGIYNRNRIGHKMNVYNIMGPLQESLSAPTPQTTASQSKHKQTKKPHHKQQMKTMQWPDNTLSSYKCFETIATPSPIPILKKINQTTTKSISSPTNPCDVQRTSSLDSLATNSDLNQSDENSTSSWFDINSDLSESFDEQPLSDCDSIDVRSDDIETKLNGTQTESDSNSNENCICNCGDSESIDNTTNNNNGINREKPIVTKIVWKKTSTPSLPLAKQCENRDCDYKQFEPIHTIDDCAPNTNFNSLNEMPSDQHQQNESKESNNNNNLTAPFILNNNNSNNQPKSRRTSVTSSGSVGRMETIIEEKSHEEPIEPKISVKEILARFETLTSLEVHKVFYFSFPSIFVSFSFFSFLFSFAPFTLTVANRIWQRVNDSNVDLDFT